MPRGLFLHCASQMKSLYGKPAHKVAYYLHQHTRDLSVRVRALNVVFVQVMAVGTRNTSMYKMSMA